MRDLCIQALREALTQDGPPEAATPSSAPHVDWRMPRFDTYPLQPTFGMRHYAFGERAIAERLGKAGLPDRSVAETWEVSDHPGAPALVSNGAYAGQTLRSLVERFPDELVAPGWQGPHFPLLLKFLDASHQLPIHLHPDDSVARQRFGEPNGKNEAWHVIWAEPAAVVYVGLKSEVSRGVFEEAALAGRLKELMHEHPVVAGDTVHVPGGVLHTFGPGMLVFEVQQTSDLAASVMPADVYGRPLSREQWLANIHETFELMTSTATPRPSAGTTVVSGGVRRTSCCVDPNFVLERWTFAGEVSANPGDAGCATLTNLGAPLTISTPNGQLTLERASSCILPAALGEVQLSVRDERGADLLVCH